MREYRKRWLRAGVGLMALFALWTALVLTVDVQSVGPNGTAVGFAAWNSWFHALTGVHMILYHITDWLGLVPVFVCMIFGALGLAQLVKRKSLRKVDGDLLLLGVYYGIVIGAYLLFEMIPINYRPVLIDGVLEASYPSSTTLLVLSVMPTLLFQAQRRLNHAVARNILCAVTVCFSVFMVVGRLMAGVHWLTDIVGAVFLSGGLFCLYGEAVSAVDERKN